MSMGATVVTDTVDAANAERFRQALEEHLVPAARSAPGYQGFLVLDQNAGKRLGLVLFASVEEAKAAQRIIGPVAGRYLYPLMASPAVGALGTAIVADGLFWDSSHAVRRATRSSLLNRDNQHYAAPASCAHSVSAARSQRRRPSYNQTPVQRGSWRYVQAVRWAWASVGYSASCPVGGVASACQISRAMPRPGTRLA